MTNKAGRRSAGESVRKGRTAGTPKKRPGPSRRRSSSRGPVARPAAPAKRPSQQPEYKSATSARMPWAQLGWRVLRGGFHPDDGPLRVLVVASWCPDCIVSLPALAPGLPGQGTVIAGEFCSVEEIVDFCGKSGVSEEVPLLAGTDVRTEPARIEARFRQLRVAFGDARKWGVPTLLEGRLEHGVFVVEKFSDPSV